MKKIIFGITDLKIGGAERVLVDLANELSKDYIVTIFTLYPNGELENDLNENIKKINCFKRPYEKYNRLVKKIISLKLLFMQNIIYKKYIKNKYDIEIAFLEGPITNLFSVKNKKTKKIAWVHTDISRVFGNTLKAKIKEKYNKKIYNKYQKIVFVSKSSLKNFEKIYNNDIPKIVINNYINYDRIWGNAQEEVEDLFSPHEINFLSVARLVEAKGLDRLIKIHSKLIKNGLAHKIYVIGEGHLREELENMISDFNVQDSFILLGAKKNPYPYIRKSDYFCLMSYYEGLPTVLLETKLLNKKIIITDNIYNESLVNYENKIIIKNNEDSIYEQLVEIIKKGKISDSKIIEKNTDDLNKEIILKIKDILK